MNRVTVGDVESAIYDFEKHFNVKYDGLTNRECIENLRSLCPKLHSEDELKEFADNLLTAILEEFGFKGLRIWYLVYIRYSICIYEGMYEKYYKLCKDIYTFVDEYRQDYGLTLKLDVFLAVVEIRELYKKRFGELEDRPMRLYSLVQTIHLSNYNPKVISELTYLVEQELWVAGDRYYCKQDLTSKNVLQELYVYLGELMNDDDVYKGHRVFYNYDGYGGVIFGYDLFKKNG